MSVCLVVPWRPDGPERARALDYVLGRYRREHPDWQIRLGTGPPGAWCKSLAVHDAAASTTAEILVLTDADVHTTGTGAAVDEVRAGAGWAIPHTLVHRLTQAATARLIGIRPGGAHELAEPAYPGMPGGGQLVLPRAVYLDIPIDPRFTGWGQEDESHAAALEALLGPAWRGTADLIHLWHPPQPRLSRARGNPEGWRLRRRYLKARHDPADMRALLQEAHDALNAHQYTVRDPAPQHRHGQDALRAAS